MDGAGRSYVEFLYEMAAWQGGVLRFEVVPSRKRLLIPSKARDLFFRW
jgi:hypothetical protein